MLEDSDSDSDSIYEDVEPDEPTSKRKKGKQQTALRYNWTDVDITPGEQYDTPLRECEQVMTPLEYFTNFFHLKF